MVYHRLVAITFPPRDVTTGRLIATLNGNVNLTKSTIPLAPLSTVTTTGMEPLTDDIRSLADKLSKLSLIHLGVYLPLYEQDGFI
jgi:hypothetical protein